MRLQGGKSIFADVRERDSHSSRSLKVTHVSRRDVRCLVVGCGSPTKRLHPSQRTRDAEQAEVCLRTSKSRPVGVRAEGSAGGCPSFSRRKYQVRLRRFEWHIRLAMMITRRLARQASAFSQSTSWTCPSCVRRLRTPLASFPSTDQNQSRPEPSLPPREQLLRPLLTDFYPPLALFSAEILQSLPIKTASLAMVFPVCSPLRPSKSLGSTIRG